MSNKPTEEEKEYRILVKNTRELLKTRFGRDFVWHVLSLADLYGSQFSGNSTTFYNEGRRSVGIDVLQLLEDADPEAYPKLLLSKMKEKFND
jgi:hypothetical protein